MLCAPPSLTLNRPAALLIVSYVLMYKSRGGRFAGQISLMDQTEQKSDADDNEAATVNLGRTRGHRGLAHTVADKEDKSFQRPYESHDENDDEDDPSGFSGTPHNVLFSPAPHSAV